MKNLFLLALVLGAVGCAQEDSTSPQPAAVPPQQSQKPSPVNDFVQVLHGPQLALKEIISLFQTNPHLKGSLSDGRTCEVRFMVKKGGADTEITSAQVNLKIQSDLVETVTYELNFELYVDEFLGNKVQMVKSADVTSINQSWVGADSGSFQMEAAEVLTVSQLNGRLTEVTVYQSTRIESSFATATCILDHNVN